MDFDLSLIPMHTLCDDSALYTATNRLAAMVIKDQRELNMRRSLMWLRIVR